LFKSKLDIKFIVASLKTLTDSRNCSESRIKFLFRLSFASFVDFLQCTFMVGLPSKFRSEKIPQNRLGTVFVIPRNTALIPCVPSVSEEAIRYSEWNGTELRKIMIFTKMFFIASSNSKSISNKENVSKAGTATIAGSPTTVWMPVTTGTSNMLETQKAEGRQQ
jgi:hypothetical protein